MTYRYLGGVNDFERYIIQTYGLQGATEERGATMATSLIGSRAAAKKQVEDLEASLAQLVSGLDQAKARLKSLVPDEPLGQGTVVRFKKYNRRYTYAAIRVGSEWYLSQNPTRPQDRKAPKYWSELLEFIGDRNWDTIEVLS